MNQKIDKNKIKRSVLSGKIVNNDKVIAVDEAEDYLKKQGYILINNKKLVPIKDVIEKIRENGFSIIPSNRADQILSLTITFISLGSLAILNNLIII